MPHASFDLRGIPLALHLNGPVDVPALLGACAAVARRHPVLGPVRITRAESSPERYPQTAAAEATRPFDLDRGPLARFTLVTVGPGRTRLLFTAHRRVFDESSKDLLVRDLADAYFSRAALPALPAACGVRDAGGDADGETEAFWRERDPGPAELVLPGLLAVPLGIGPGEIVEMVLGETESRAVGAAAEALGASRFEVLLAVVGVLLRRYGTVASPLALDLGTRTRDTSGHIGPFAVEVPFLPHPGPGDEFPGHLRAVQAELRALRRFRHAPPAPTSRPVLFSYRRRTAAPSFPGAGAAVEWTVFNGAARGALHVQAVDAGRSLTIGLRFNPTAIGHDDVSQIAVHLRALLRAVAAEPRAKVADLVAPTHLEPDEEPPVTDLFAPAPGDVTQSQAEDTVTAQVREIWEETLRLDDIGLDEDIFDLGGHSLTVTQIIAKTRRRLGVEVSIDVFFDNPTIAGVAEEVVRLRGELG
ncbi:hypothetical protein GCM10010517_77360 [Streptosporangium fragile]|uniref:Carrier domain-containing protein n=1 Tax=Streptosporangium fragile TaxID=46186 RepID=A0ABN3WEN0_9ACTN